MFRLVYLQTDPLPVVQGRLFGIGQRNAHQWLHGLLVGLRTTLRTLGEAPTRALTAWAQRLGRAEAAAAAMVAPPGEPAPASPRGGTTGPHGASRPQDPTAHTRGDRGKNTGHTVHNVLLLNAARTRLVRSATSVGSPHDPRLADGTPSPLPAGRRWLHERGFPAFTLPQVDVLMPTQKPRGRPLPRAQTATQRRLARRRVRSEQVHSSVKRCRIVHDTCRLRQASVRDLVMEVCGAWHHFRVRLIPWPPLVESG